MDNTFYALTPEEAAEAPATMLVIEAFQFPYQEEGDLIDRMDTGREHKAKVAHLVDIGNKLGMDADDYIDWSYMGVDIDNRLVDILSQQKTNRFQRIGRMFDSLPDGHTLNEYQEKLAKLWYDECHDWGYDPTEPTGGDVMEKMGKQLDIQNAERAATNKFYEENPFYVKVSISGSKTPTPYICVSLGSKQGAMTLNAYIYNEQGTARAKLFTDSLCMHLKITPLNASLLDYPNTTYAAKEGSGELRKAGRDDKELIADMFKYVTAGIVGEGRSLQGWITSVYPLRMTCSDGTGYDIQSDYAIVINPPEFPLLFAYQKEYSQFNDTREDYDNNG